MSRGHQGIRGLPSCQSFKVRLYNPASPKDTLLAAATGPGGNILLKLPRQPVTSPDNRAQVAIEVLTPAGKTVYNGPALPVELNQTATVLIPLPASADLAPHLQAANSAMAFQQALLSAATAKVDTLQKYYQQEQDDLKQQLQELQGIMAGLQKGSS